MAQPRELIVSWSGTRHIVGVPPAFQSVRAHGTFRVTVFVVSEFRRDEVRPLSEATRDCPFCLAELLVIERQTHEQQGQAADQAA
jgi:hypothetical protein